MSSEGATVVSTPRTETAPQAAALHPGQILHPGQAPNLPPAAMGAAPLATGTRLQEFEISAVIGQGGFGVVYLARDLSLQRMVAIKEYMPAQLAGRNPDTSVRPLTAGQSEVFELGRRSFINEARMLARFKHPGLLQVLRFWEQNGTAYMAMPYYDGATLTQYLKRHPGIATEEWLKKTLKPLLNALGHMHQEDCFHRDVAPDNILILKDGSAVLLDLGAARRVIADDAQAMTVMLKPGYAPIEQYADDPRFRQGPWTDVYAMAAVFFFGVTGKAPPASASRVMRDSVSPLANVRPEGFSEGFLRAIDQGLSLHPEDRPRSIDEFRSLLYATAAPVPAPPSGPWLAQEAKPERDARQSKGAEPAYGAIDPKAAGRHAEARAGDRRSRRNAGPGSFGPVAGGVAVVAVALAVGWQAMRPAAKPSHAAGALVRPAGVIVAPNAATGTVAKDSAAPAPAAAVPPAAATAPKAATTAAFADGTAPAAAPAAALAATTPATVAPPAVTPPTVKTAAEADVQKPAATNGTLVLDVKPWAEVRVNGVLKGVSPPLKQLALPSGRHLIEFRNPAAAPVSRQVEVRINAKSTISQRF